MTFVQRIKTFKCVMLVINKLRDNMIDYRETLTSY